MNRFQKLSLATTAMTLLLIGVGGTVRGTGSGLGCPDWPRCHGKWYPPLEEEKAPAPGWWMAADGKWYPPDKKPHNAPRAMGVERVMIRLPLVVMTPTR